MDIKYQNADLWGLWEGGGGGANAPRAPPLVAGLFAFFFFLFCFVLFNVLAAFLYFIGIHFGANRMLSLACADFKLFFRIIVISLVAVDIMCLRKEEFICIIIAATRSKTSSESKRGNQEENDIQMPPYTAERRT